MRLEGKKIALTGGTGGLGRPVVQRLLAEGAQVTVISRSAVAESGTAAVACDIASDEGIGKAAAALVALAPDVLIHLAGAQYFGAYERADDGAVMRDYHTNLLAPAMLTKAVLPAMLARQSGHVVFAGSVFGAIPFAHFAAYSSAKAGLAALCMALKREYAGRGVSFSLVTPRAVKTPMATDKIRQFAHVAGFGFDQPEVVAQRIVAVVQQGQGDVAPGLPESFFMRLNALVPGLVSRGLKTTNAKARKLLHNESSDN